MQSSTQILKGKVVWGQNSTWVLTWRKLVTYWQLLFLLYLMFHLLLRRQLTGENLADADFRGWAKWVPFKGDGGIWWSERFQCWHHIAQWIEHLSRDSGAWVQIPVLSVIIHFSLNMLQWFVMYISMFCLSTFFLITSYIYTLLLWNWSLRAVVCEQCIAGLDQG